MADFTENEDGTWCPSCGQRVAGPAQTAPDECFTCGFPDLDQVAEYHSYDPSEDESEEPEFDCGMTSDGTCTLAGSEDCDWECPYS